MKQIMFFFSFLVILVSSCKYTSKAQTENNIHIAADMVTFHIHEIDSVNYYTLKEQSGIQSAGLEKLTDFEQVKKMLDGRVIWSRYDDEAHEIIEDKEGDIVKQILFSNGKTLSYDYPELYFIAYFPEEDILLLEGGHCSSHTFNLTTGEETEEVGNPDYWRYSPSGKYRFNGYDNGQANVYFIQEKRAGKYETILDNYLSSIIDYIDFIPEYIPDVYWQNDSTLNFMVPLYYYPEDKTQEFYYQHVLH